MKGIDNIVASEYEELTNRTYALRADVTTDISITSVP